MKFYDDRDESGPAADTGSAVHKAAHAFHTLAKGDARLSIAVMQQAINEYPLADLSNAEKQFRAYAEDERNSKAEIVLTETQVKFTLPPWTDDPTKEEIVIVGTLDQVRREGRDLVCCDIKTGKRLDGYDMIAAHAIQLAAYQVGASEKLNAPVQRACIIRTQDYVRPRVVGPVFWQASWDLTTAKKMLESVRRVVSLVRSRGIWFAPGEHCRWCIGVEACIPKLEMINHVQATKA